MSHVKVMKQALEALENGRRVRNYEGGTQFQPDLENTAIAALREALATPGNQLDDINVVDMAAPNSVEIDGIRTVAQHATLVKCTYGDGGRACCEGGPCRAEEQNNAALAEPQVEPVASTAKDAIMWAAYEFRDAHISGSNNLKRSAHAALVSAVDAALQPVRQAPAKNDVQSAFEDWLEKTRPSGDVEDVQRQWEYSSECEALYAAPAQQQNPDALHLAAMDLARKQAQRIAELEAEVERFRQHALNERTARKALEQQPAARVPLTEDELWSLWN